MLGYFNPAGDPAGDALIPSLIGSALFLQERERYGGNIGIQFRPSDALEINITGLYSRFGADNFNQNYLAWGTQAIGGGGTLSNFTVSNGTVVSGPHRFARRRARPPRRRLRRDRPRAPSPRPGRAIST